MKAPAYLVFRFISFIFVGMGLSFMSILGLHLFSNAAMVFEQQVLMFVLGTPLLFVGVVGPVRILVKGAQTPVETKRLIVIHAVLMPVSGLIFLAAGILNEPIYGEVACFTAGIFAVISALGGLYPLSNKLPHTFSVGEMLAIVKSAGLSGDKKDSPANQAMSRWTKGRAGVRVGSKAPDGDVIPLSGEEVSLSTYFGKKRLVLNFGSYSCPHHRKRMQELNTLMEKWRDRDVAFLTVYIAEAHPEDGWKLKDQYVSDAEYTREDDFCFFYAKSIAERQKMAAWLVEKKDFTMPLVLDSMEDSLLKAYNAWPVRLYIIEDSKVVYCGEQGPFGYEPSQVDIALKKMESGH